MSPEAIAATTLYVQDLSAARDFYATVLGLRLACDRRPAGMVFRVNERQVVRVCDAMHAGEEPGMPAHGAQGRCLLTLMIADGSYEAWVEHLRAAHVPLAKEIVWDDARGGRAGSSLFVRDPSGNLIELVTTDIWPE